MMHDPSAIFRFEEHDIFIPMTVLEELDAGKKGMSEAARNVRQVSRFLDELMANADKPHIDRGLELPPAKYTPGGKKPPSGRLFFQTRQLLASGLPDTLPGHGADNAILAQTLALQKQHPDAQVTLVSKDINLRIKAAILGVHAEDYYSDKTIEDADLLYTGVEELPANFWDRAGRKLESWHEQGGRSFYRVRGKLVANWAPNQFVYQAGEHGIEAVVRRIEGDSAVLEVAARLSQRASRRLGHQRAQSRAELRAEPAARPGHRFRHDPRPRRHGQDAADARGRAVAGARDQPLHRDHHDARDDPARRGHRLPARHRGRKDGALDGRADGQPRGAHAEPGRRQLGPRGDQRPAAQPHQDPLAQFHARAHVPEPLPDPRRGAEPDAEADEGADHARGPRHEARVPRQHRADRLRPIFPRRPAA